MLTEEDFRDQHPSSVQAELVGTQEAYHVSYFVELVRLAFLLGRVLSIGYTPGRAWDDEASKLLAADFQQWQCALPLDMFQRPFKHSTEPGFWACMLHLSYHNALILFCRPRTIESVTRQDSERDITVRSSSDAVTRLAEDLLSSDTLRYAQVHIIPTLFGALSIHSLIIGSRQLVAIGALSVVRHVESHVVASRSLVAQLLVYQIKRPYGPARAHLILPAMVWTVY
ncbi:hypothetical protein H2204_007519 [Knufia peltigerae]|uniref:Transcription factor domain-containing protein n=1 Tax=Knufia peltigerae TaxID=1002370 RepID=A0AA38Y2U2_9EURO|nr:hypothetical protein H2204_007519 [Knufia peltigerae]